MKRYVNISGQEVADQWLAIRESIRETSAVLPDDHVSMAGGVRDEYGFGPMATVWGRDEPFCVGCFMFHRKRVKGDINIGAELMPKGKSVVDYHNWPEPWKSRYESAHFTKDQNAVMIDFIDEYILATVAVPEEINAAVSQ